MLPVLECMHCEFSLSLFLSTPSKPFLKALHDSFSFSCHIARKSKCILSFCLYLLSYLHWFPAGAPASPPLLTDPMHPGQGRHLMSNGMSHSVVNSASDLHMEHLCRSMTEHALDGK